MLLARFDFQACLIDRSSISPFRINDLRSPNVADSADCDKSSNAPRSLTGFSSIAAVCARGPMTLHLRESTIHEQFDSRNVAAIVGCEKHDGFSSLIGRSEPSERNALGDHLFAFLTYL